MVQAACLDSAGLVRAGAVPGDPDCGRRRPLSVGDALPYRKHDWAAVQLRASQPRGWVASDSLRGTLFGRPAILQGWDFGDMPQREFGRFDAGLGDGGQVVLIGPDGSAAAVMTEDGGEGVQWIPSPACVRSGGQPTAGWLFAAQPVTTAWRERVVQATRVARPEICPSQFSTTLTRWRLARIDLPMRETSDGSVRTVPVETLVSEHFGRATVPTAEHLERFFFARDLGLVRWERWEDRATSRFPRMEEFAAMIATQQRCPPLAFSDPPEPSWIMIDCRTYTNLVRATGDAAMLHAPAWPAASP